MNEINSLQELIVNFRDERNWKQFHNPKDLAISLMLEAGELLEHFQWKNEKETALHIKEHKGLVANELADVFYWLLLISSDFDIDLRQALLSKMEQNEQKYPIALASGNHKKYSEL